jgi:hypothetical protein
MCCSQNGFSPPSELVFIDTFQHWKRLQVGLKASEEMQEGLREEPKNNLRGNT